MTPTRDHWYILPGGAWYRVCEDREDRWDDSARYICPDERWRGLLSLWATYRTYEVRSSRVHRGDTYFCIIVCMAFLFGLIMIISGIAIIRYRYEIHHITGNWGWAETYLSGTVNAIVLFGMLLIAAGTAYPLGAFEGFLAPGSFAPPGKK